jgi:Phage tail sheath protein subtilisin-like domain/Phage tail sheath C-terminal domain
MFLVSPGVQVNEKDLSNVVPAVATSIGAYAGPFKWGPIGIPVTVSSEVDLVTNFGKPDAAHAVPFLTAASFLKYGNTLKVSRSINSSATNAISTYITNSGSGSYVSASTSVLIGNIDQFNSLSSSAASPVGSSSYTFIARYPGTPGNSLGVYVVTAATSPTDSYAAKFDYVPTYNSNNTTVVTASNSTITASQSTVLVSSASFLNTSISTSMYVIGTGITAGSAARVQSFSTTGSNYLITLSSSFITSTTSAKLTFFEPDEVHVAVVDIDGGISGTSGTLIEKWQNLSLYTDGKRPDGTNNYYRDYINRNSSWIYGNTLVAEIPNADSSSSNLAFINLPITTSSLAHVLGNSNTLGITGTPGVSANGTDGIVGDSGDISNAIKNVFYDAATIDINLLFCGDTNGTTGSLTPAEQAVQDTANTRKDVVGFISAPLNIWQQTSNSAKQAAVLAKFNDQSATHDSYSVFDSTPLYVYNKYQDNYVWIPACGHMAGLCANTDTVADAWFSPAGYNRGNLKGVTKLAYNADQTGRDALYQASINPIVSFPGQGILLFGDKTAQSKPSAFDRINVRRLFIVLEKAISTAAKYQLFELNDQFTQAMFRNMTEPFLRDIQGRRGITDFLVVCDSTNNTPAVVDANQFVADIYIKPARSINFITLNFIATRTGVSFSEIAGASNA